MKRLFLLLTSCLLPFTALAADREDLAKKFKQLPTVPEAELPELSNKPGAFRGVINHEGLEGSTYVAFPFLENAASLDMDPKGRIYVSEANRFWLGVPDLRGANEMIRDDFQAITVQDRLDMYDKFSENFPEGWFSAVADRIVRFEDRDGNGAADHRSLFSNHFHQPADGIGFSILAEDDAVYFTCIPKVWKMTDSNDDGQADTHEGIVDGFGVRVSFIGHDLHGIIRGPDGRLYFSIGDRGYHVTTQEGEIIAASGRGAVFRCESDGSGFEHYAMGLRNPQELAFDNHGNLFTFDNTGDIGDKARFVYVLENSDSGWDMSHQSAHQYATVLDWGEFRPPKSMWVAERMFDTWNEEQPQWVYPPASHVSEGPSGVTWLSGEAIPGDLRNQFLLANYRGATNRCTVLAIGMKPKGAGYEAENVRELITGIGVSDVELGYDGKLYLADFGGGWSVNENASVQVVAPTDESLRKTGQTVAKLFATGLSEAPTNEVVALLSDSDQRVRLLAQFALTDRQETKLLTKLAQDAKASRQPRLHAIWALGQLHRQNPTADLSKPLLPLLKDKDEEVRANAARVLGDNRITEAREGMLTLLADKSLRVRSLAAIALGRICEPGDLEATEALYQASSDPVDVVLRHSLLSALDRIGTPGSALIRATHEDREQRMLAVLALRRHEDPSLVLFMDDADAQIRREVLRAIYDTVLVDGPLGEKLAALNPSGMPEPLQRRIVAANYRLGQTEHAKRLLALAGKDGLSEEIRLAALHGLEMWEAAVDTDPVLGHFRPQIVVNRSQEDIGDWLSQDFQHFLKEKHEPEILALAIQLTRDAGIQLDPEIMRVQAKDPALNPSIRVEVLESLASLKAPEDDKVLRGLLVDKNPKVRAAAIRLAFQRNLDGMQKFAEDAIASDALLPARAAIAGAKTDTLEALWNQRDSKLRKELWLDVYLALQTAGSSAITEFASAAPTNPQTLTKFGGSPEAGEVVFRNQGACLQCHMIGKDGGVQGPPLTLVGQRLDRDKILESLIDPNAVITEGYGMSTVTGKDGSVAVGRIAKDTKKELVVIGLDGTETRMVKDNVDSITPPMSAMPPMAMALPLPDLRDLISYLATRTKQGEKKDDSSHGEEGEEIAK